MAMQSADFVAFGVGIGCPLWVISGRNMQQLFASASHSIADINPHSLQRPLRARSEHICRCGMPAFARLQYAGRL